MKPEAPQKEHEWLHRLVGEWVYETGGGGEPTQPGEHMRGTETVRSLGGLWVVAEGRETAGGPVTTIMTLGFDSRTGRFVGTWIGAMMSHLWVYDGELDAERRVLSLGASGPAMSGDGTMARYQDVIEFRGDDHRVLTARVEDGPGRWRPLMSVAYRRA